ncbi:hypothetical protein BSKO_12014 [Bryopsis sp. KO-2023]|nr:hypothetical protein BSKO_12014 [Bryopsis sp. KO-2023]
MSETPSSGENGGAPPSVTVPQYNPPRQRSAPPIVGERSESPQGSNPHQRATSVPGYPSPVPYAAGYGTAAPPAGGTYGQAMFPPPLPPAMYSPHTYQGSSGYPPQAPMPYAGPPPTGYPPPPNAHVYPQQYHLAQMGGSPQLMYPGYAKPMSGNVNYPSNYHPSGNRPQPFNVAPPQAAVNTAKYLPAFHETTARQSFIRKVICLVLIQLAVTTAMGAAALSVNSLQEYLKENMWVFWASWVSALAILIFGACNYSMLRQHPMNMLFLFSFTALCATMVASVIARYDSEVVLLTFIVATGLVFALVMMASRASFDITNWGGMLFAFLLVLMVTSIVGVFWVNSIFKIVFSAIGAVVFSIYLVYDVQMLLGDKKRALNPDDYILGAITIYLDIINIFLYLLSLIGLARSRNAGE